MIQFANNASTVISSAVAVGDLAINVSDASEFPAVTPADPCYATLEQAPTDPQVPLADPAIEVVLVTGITGNVLTVVRAQEGTTARAWSIGDYCENRITKNTLDNFIQDETFAGHVNDQNNPHVVTAAQAGADPVGSAATVQSALDTHVADVANPHQVDFMQAGAAPHENGFVNRADSAIAFDDATRTFSITPTGTEYVIWAGGKKYTKTLDEFSVIADTTGGVYFYFNEDGLLFTTDTWDVALYSDVAYIAAVYWDAVHGESIILSDERHGVVMDHATVISERQTEGASFESGIAPGNINTDGSGDVATDAQISVGSGFFWNQDIRFDIPSVAAPASIPFVYREGAGTGGWHRIAGTGYVCTTTGTGRPAWNEDTGTTWQLSEVSNLDFVLMHLYATNDPTQPLVWVVGQQQYNTLQQARQGALVEINTMALGGYPAIEQLAVATFIIQGSNGYTNAVKARIRSTDTGDDFIDWRKVSVGAGGSSSGDADLVQANLDTHIADQTNPHVVTAAQVGAVPYAPAATTNIIPTDPAVIPLAVKGAAAQTGDIFRVRAADNTDILRCEPDRSIYMFGSPLLATINSSYSGGAFAAGRFRVTTGAVAGATTALSAETQEPDRTALVAQAAALQTANILEIKNSAGTVINGFDKDGSLIAAAQSNAVVVDPPAGTSQVIVAGSATDSALRLRGGGTAAPLVVQDAAATWMFTITAAGQASATPQDTTAHGFLASMPALSTGSIVRGTFDGTTVFYTTAAGRIWTKNKDRTAPSRFGSRCMLQPEAAEPGLVVSADTSQTANMAEFRDGADNVLTSIGPAGALTVNAAAATTVPFTVKGALSQTANLLTVTDSADTVLTSIGPAGALTVNAAAATAIPVTIKAAASQTAQLLTVTDSADTAIAAITNAAHLALGSYASGTSKGVFLNSLGYGCTLVDDDRTTASIVTNAVLNLNPQAGRGGFAIRGNASQTANIMTVTNSAASTIMRVTAGGNVAGTGAYTNLSSFRALKDNIEDSPGKDEVKTLKPRKYRMKETGKVENGFVIEELEAINHPAIVKDADGTTVGYQAEQLIPTLARAVQELMADVEQLQGQIDTLKAKK